MKKSPIYKLSVDCTVGYMPDRHPTLQELQKAVGGYIEVVQTDSDGTIMIVDEEGRLKRKKWNKKASYKAGKAIAGDVVIMPDSYLE